MDRRAFIKLTAITGSAATLASCGSPEDQFIRFIPDEEVVPGVAVYKPSVCPACQAGCGLSVRVMEGDADVIKNGQTGRMKMGVAKKLEGAAANPINQGGLCPRGQAAIQITYHPDRIKNPLKLSGARGSGQYKDISWDEAIAELVAKLDAAAGADKTSLAFLTRARRSRRQDLIAMFLERFGALPPIVFELFSDDVLRRANALSFGHEQLPTFDLAKSKYVLAFGADFLGTWNSPVSQNAGYGDLRRGHPGGRGKFVQIESRMSQTGANADEWIPVKPGTEGVLALGLANVMIAEKLRPGAGAGQAGAQIDGWSGGLGDYSPEQVEKQTGVPAARISRLAREFAATPAAVAIVGGPPLALSNGLFTALAVNALNALAGSVGADGGLHFMPQVAAPPARRGGLDTIGGENIQLLLVDDANPVFTAPKAWNVKASLEKIPYIASFATFLDETSVLSDLILPDHSFLESWVDARPESGALVAVAAAAAPAMKPLHQTRAMPDVLLEVSKKLQTPLNLDWDTFDAMISEGFAKLPESEAGDAWTVAQAQGAWWGALPAAPAAPAAKGRSGSPAPPATAVAAMKFVEPAFDGAAGEYPFYFLPYASQAFLDGSLAHLPWLQELPDPLTSAMWSNWVEINSATAAKLGIAHGDMVEIKSSQGAVQAPAVITPGIAPDLVAMPVGQGHERFTRYASGRGSNPASILAPVTDADTGALAWAATRVQIRRAGDAAAGTLILFAGEQRDIEERER